MIFPSNVFGYSGGCEVGVVASFRESTIKIVKTAKITTYKGGRISWNVIRWGKCPNVSKALQDNLIVFENLDKAVERLKRYIEVSE